MCIEHFKRWDCGHCSSPQVQKCHLTHSPIQHPPYTPTAQTIDLDWPCSYCQFIEEGPQIERREDGGVTKNWLSGHRGRKVHLGHHRGHWKPWCGARRRAVTRVSTGIMCSAWLANLESRELCNSEVSVCVCAYITSRLTIEAL